MSTLLTSYQEWRIGQDELVGDVATGVYHAYVYACGYEIAPACLYLQPDRPSLLTRNAANCRLCLAALVAMELSR